MVTWVQVDKQDAPLNTRPHCLAICQPTASTAPQICGVHDRTASSCSTKSLFWLTRVISPEINSKAPVSEMGAAIFRLWVCWFGLHTPGPSAADRMYLMPNLTVLTSRLRHMTVARVILLVPSLDVRYRH
ncbi:hypothetical protein COCCADRAFT_23178 [Bipolaris zeicola 26-R-13]|uniref:Uncharacterized protein n=1 Tax=Cochliobolus carbonum (strain 26-R-13) TaxID=930089 RepID=W6YHQ4_COCC2|nr:uncharacterized protein COCCADRAFT_23178 [Bipolaris zeicola 26-R-13]EUC37090.1 hypothetical protein COCCADRAFT_23178 [Bipolaris zeicola 26-R-13]